MALVRAWLAWAIIALASAGCTAVPVQPEVPIVHVTSDAQAFDASGAPWHPSVEGTACAWFILDTTAHKVSVDTAHQPKTAPAAFVIVEPRDPTAGVPLPDLRMPLQLPFNFTLSTLSPRDGPIVSLTILNDSVLVGERTARANSPVTIPLAYNETLSDGTRLSIRENLTVAWIGMWKGPLVVIPPICGEPHPKQ